MDANTRLSRHDFPDFNDSNKLGNGADKVQKLGNLIAIFENPALDFSQSRAENDDILGDAYEYLMRHFASQRGKSKGQFYTPSEVSRIMANVIGISPANSKAATTAYDPTCGSGSLLLNCSSPAILPLSAMPSPSSKPNSPRWSSSSMKGARNNAARTGCWLK